MKKDIKGIAVYCASSTDIDEKYKESARLTGRILAEKRFRW